jgi:serine/threonine protein kinase/Tol biopolymer transport system component
MDSDRWRQIKQLYHEARARPEPEREAFLAEACADDHVLLGEIRRLLAQPVSTDIILGRLGGPELELVASHRDEARPSLVTGQRIGVYQVQALLGAGGMGEVYRARDTRLGRDVAIKMLPRALTVDPDRLIRLEREARVLASLNHPHIAAIHGLEESDGPALVLELIEGETLRERLARGSLPLAETLHIARQIAEALKAAHEKGIVHRDLKPANIKITPESVVKVLDFGIAKVASDQGPWPDSTRASRPTSSGTLEGAIVGTAAYMSPEQARGGSVDRRTDVWAFGCVLYEMLSGRMAFARETVTDTHAAIVDQEPEWTAVPATTPPAVRRLLRRCLEKDPKQRLGDIGDARVDLEQPAAASVHHRRSSAAVLVVVTLLLLAATAGMVYSTRPSALVTSPSEYTQLTNFTDSAMAPSLSPDGRMVTFIRGGGDGFPIRGQIYVKQLPNGESVPLIDDAGVKYGPVFTHDGSRIAYTKVTPTATGVSWDTWTVPVFGGPAARFVPNAAGLVWLGERRVLFGEIKTGIHMGIVTATESRAERREIYFPAHDKWMAHFSYLSPDRQSVLVVEMDETHFFTQCRLVPFDGSSAGRQVGPRGICKSAAWSPDGRWMYFGVTVGGSSHLWRQRFPDGTPEQLTFGPTEEDGVAVAPDGQSLVTSLGHRQSAVWIHDAAGERAITSEGFARLPRFSRDGTRAFYLLQQDSSSSSAELRTVDLGSGKSESVLPGVSVTDYDISRDEKEIAYTTKENNGESRIWLASLDRRSPPREIARGGDQVSFGTDGDLLFRSLEEKTNSLARIKKNGSGRKRIEAVPIVYKTGVSPDGAWAIVVAAGAGEHSQPQTLAVPVNGGNPQKICSPSCPAVWSADGRFLYLARGATVTSLGMTIAIPVPAGKSLPDLPASGVVLAAAAKLPGALVIEHDLVSPGADPSTYLFTKSDFQRNLFRIPLH